MPGIDMKTLSRMTGINENTMRYHLDRLIATGKISCFTRPGIVRYFQNQGAYNQYEHTAFHYLLTDTPREILCLLYQHPGLTRQQIADALMISGPSITRQMDNLIEDRIVENRFPGRSNHYYLTTEGALTIDKLMSQAPLIIHKENEGRPIPASVG
jgi:predicted transcriptional regulator